ncbi:hypothetical protein V1478_000036 [Vespula squamosa]|uniref:Uncharacterized protein n=1 Tax=Vespula squamosa TaxID=30214 RepID=A0ABD2C9U7_VESSQ
MTYIMISPYRKPIPGLITRTVPGTLQIIEGNVKRTRLLERTLEMMFKGTLWNINLECQNIYQSTTFSTCSFYT